jgi:4-hydroxythreonine-4-phosphate dehydrogenase
MTIIGITMGCPAGIGPEIILRYYAQFKKPADVQAVVLGDTGVLEKCRSQLQLPISCTSWIPGTPLPDSGVPVVQLSSLDPDKLVWGQPDKNSGKAMARYIEAGVELTQQGFLNGLATCPISKASLNGAGYHFPGHTEMLASLTGSKDFAMMMAGSKLKVTLVTIHCPLREVSAALNKESICNMIKITHRALKIDFGLSNPRIGVAGFNPHGGENLLFGSEEKEIIAPAVSRCRKENINVSGPYPPDTVFFKAASGAFDTVVCMYHDQGLIPFKLLHFEDGVNVTLGLPIVRTSVDHGTAYDIAGKGLASHQSLCEAVKMAAVINRNRTSHEGD